MYTILNKTEILLYIGVTAWLFSLIRHFLAQYMYNSFFLKNEE